MAVREVYSARWCPTSVAAVRLDLSRCFAKGSEGGGHIMKFYPVNGS